MRSHPRAGGAGEVAARMTHIGAGLTCVLSADLLLAATPTTDLSTEMAASIRYRREAASDNHHHCCHCSLPRADITQGRVSEKSQLCTARGNTR